MLPAAQDLHELMTVRLSLAITDNYRQLLIKWTYINVSTFVHFFFFNIEKHQEEFSKEARGNEQRSTLEGSQRVEKEPLQRNAIKGFDGSTSLY